MAKNVLFIMCDQLRWDYLSCTGHPTLRTPNIDALADRGVRFDRAYVQSPICGPSRMSAYSGRYARSHGASWNGFPLRVDEWTLGDHLSGIGGRAVLCGKTHMVPNPADMQRLGIDPEGQVARRVTECGFEVWDRLDGLHPSGGPPELRPDGPSPTGGKMPSHYNDYLRSVGCGGENPWEEWAATCVAPDGALKNGWLNENAHLPARVPEEHSETAYSTSRAIEFMEKNRDGAPWCLHLSYIKPHWPMVAPAPYHDMYGPDDVVPVVRSDAERETAHPVIAANMEARHSTIYGRQGARERVVACYMGLVKQIDDHIGRLMAFMDESGLAEDTLIVFTSDHGDYLGDHWMGEKAYFHDCSVRVPMIVVDPSAEADGTRGTVDDRLVEMIDVVPTAIDFMGGHAPSHIVEGRSLLPLLRGEAVDWRDAVFSEYDYSTQRPRRVLEREPMDCRMQMVFDGRWKYVHAQGFRPMLFDLQGDPDELVDLGADPAFEGERARLRDRLLDWALAPANRTTVSEARIKAMGPGAFVRGIWIGFWDEADAQEAITAVSDNN